MGGPRLVNCLIYDQTNTSLDQTKSNKSNKSIDQTNTSRYQRQQLAVYAAVFFLYLTLAFVTKQLTNTKIKMRKNH